MKKNLIATIIASALVSPVVFAEAPSYSFVDVNYTSLDADGLDAKGVGFAGSFAFNEHFFIAGEYAPLEGDLDIFGTSVDFDFDISGIGFGFKSEFSDTSSWYASYTLGTWSIEGEDLDIDTLRIGLRSMMSEKFELNGSVASHDLEDSGSETGFQIGMAYEMGDNVHLVADYESIDDVDVLNIGARWSF